jgi:hypothetical protein
MTLNDDITAGGRGGDANGAGPDSINIATVGSDAGGSGNLLVPNDILFEAENATFVIQNTFDTPANVELQLASGTVEVATGTQDTIEFAPGSDATALQQPSAEFDSWLNLFGISFGNFGNVSVNNVLILNPAAVLIGLETIAFVDTGLFEEELTLYGVIGNGIALALAQCEEVEGCAPNVTEEELDELIAGLEARIAELEKRLAEATGAGERALLEELIAGYRAELEDFKRYRVELKEFFAEDEEEEDFEEDFDEDFGEEELPVTPPDSSEVERLADILNTVKARIEWLESLKDDPEERARLSEATGIELTLEALDGIIEGAKAEALFIENQIRLLIEGTEAMAEPEPVFVAEARDYNSISTIKYGPELLVLANSDKTSGQRWY